MIQDENADKPVFEGIVSAGTKKEMVWKVLTGVITLKTQYGVFKIILMETQEISKNDYDLGGNKPNNHLEGNNMPTREKRYF